MGKSNINLVEKGNRNGEKDKRKLIDEDQEKGHEEGRVRQSLEESGGVVIRHCRVASYLELHLIVQIVAMWPMGCDLLSLTHGRHCQSIPRLLLV